MQGLTVVDHPLLAATVTRLRDETTLVPEFRRLLDQAATLMIADVTRDLATKAVRVKTPLAMAPGAVLRRPVILVPILRAGLAFLDAFQRVMPTAKVGFVGVKRDAVTHQAHTYSSSLPDDLKGLEVIVLDPMLATGGSAVATLDLLWQRGARQLRLVTLVSAPPGVETVLRAHPSVRVYTAALDPKLNSQAYIVPGLGDAGDRAFGV
ncbi:MAG TPA: uracil phosphoribosyltransferase [Candidatus Limnocylindria bacterium]|jgi:uracil phosphoribosyltransferase|nr:uracil phosphoribosyltransferase [Candidatus Limnocylindria bacterium]